MADDPWGYRALVFFTHSNQPTMEDNGTLVLNGFKMNQMFTETNTETLQEVMKEDIIWLTEY